MTDHRTQLRSTQFRAFYRELRIREQQKYYADRRREYELAHRQAIVTRNGLLALAVFAGVASQFVAGTARGVFGIVAAMFGALAGAVTAFEALIGYASLTKLYRDTALNLAEAEIEWDADESADGVATAVERVEKIFRAENGQWGQLVIQGSAEHATVTQADGRYPV